MNRYARPSSSCRSRSRLMTWDCVDMSSALTGSSQTISFGFEGQGTGDGDALALPAGELRRDTRWRCVGPGRPARAAPPPARRAPAGPNLPCTSNGSPTMLGDRGQRVERRVRVLEHHLHVPAQGAQLRRGLERAVPPVEPHRPAGRLDEPQHHPAGGRLARAALAHQAERLAGWMWKSTRPRPARRGRRRAGGPDGERLVEPADVEQGLPFLVPTLGRGHEGHLMTGRPRDRQGAGRRWGRGRSPRGETVMRGTS